MNQVSPGRRGSEFFTPEPSAFLHKRVELLHELLPVSVQVLVLLQPGQFLQGLVPLLLTGE